MVQQLGEARCVRGQTWGNDAEESGWTEVSRPLSAQAQPDGWARMVEIPVRGVAKPAQQRRLLLQEREFHGGIFLPGPGKPTLVRSRWMMKSAPSRFTGGPA